MGKPLDWSKAGTVEAMGKWILKESGAVLVLVIRPEDAVLVLPQGVRDSDAEGVIYAGLGDALERRGSKEAAAKAREVLKTIRKGVNAA